MPRRRRWAPPPGGGWCTANGLTDGRSAVDIGGDRWWRESSAGSSGDSERYSSLDGGMPRGSRSSVGWSSGTFSGWSTTRSDRRKDHRGRREFPVTPGSASLEPLPSRSILRLTSSGSDQFGANSNATSSYPRSSRLTGCRPPPRDRRVPSLGGITVGWFWSTTGRNNSMAGGQTDPRPSHPGSSPTPVWTDGSLPPAPRVARSTGRLFLLYYHCLSCPTPRASSASPPTRSSAATRPSEPTSSRGSPSPRPPVGSATNLVPSSFSPPDSDTASIPRSSVTSPTAARISPWPLLSTTPSSPCAVSGSASPTSPEPSPSGARRSASRPSGTCWRTRGRSACPEGRRPSGAAPLLAPRSFGPHR